MGDRVGIDVGGTKVAGVRISPSGAGWEVVDERRAATSAPAELLDVIAGVVDDLDPAGTLPLGVGLPGLVDRAGVLRFAPNLGGVVHLDALARFSDRPASVRVDNDANCAGVAEVELGAARGRRHVVVLTLGTGIGGAVFNDGAVVRGAHGFAGEVGHVVVVPGGRPCGCGRAGCWEQYVSGGALGRRAMEVAAGGGLGEAVRLAGEAASLTGEHVTAAARSGDADAVALFEEMGEWLGRGVASLVAVLDVDTVVVGGGLVEGSDLFLDAARRVVAAEVMGAPARPDVEILAAAAGPRAGAIGAALLEA